MNGHRNRTQGFTLLEVMVAVAILGLGLTAIFSSQGGAIKAAHRARKMKVATLLARCKMAELEEHVAREGLPAVEYSEEDGCCDGAEIEGYQCASKIERVVLPDDFGEEGEGTEESTDALSELTEAEGEDADATVDGLLSGDSAGGGISEMAMNIAFPILKPAIEEQVRVATVEIKWKEGTREKSFDVVQYLVAEQPASTEETDPVGDPSQTQGEGSSSPGQSSTGSTGNSVGSGTSNSGVGGATR